MHQETRNSWNVITGAASGFGRALALELAREGKRLLLADIQEAGLEETAQLARAAGAAEAKTAQCDVTQVEQIQALSAACADAPIALLINNAGVATTGLFEEISIEDWKWTLDIDLFGVIHGCHVFLPRFRQQGWGKIINVASAAGLVSLPRLAAYNAAKAGVVALSESLSGELRSTQITVSVVCPTFFQTSLMDTARFTEKKLHRIGEKLLRQVVPAPIVAQRTLRLARKGKLYILPMWDARLAWLGKRLMPALFQRFLAKAAYESLNFLEGRS